MHISDVCGQVSPSYNVWLRAQAVGRGAASQGFGMLNKCAQSGTRSSRVTGRHHCMPFTWLIFLNDGFLFFFCEMFNRSPQSINSYICPDHSEAQ